MEYRTRFYEMFVKSKKTVWQIAKDGDLDYNTVRRYVDGETGQRITVSALLRLLRGMGYPPEQIKRLTLADIIDLRDWHG